MIMAGKMTEEEWGREVVIDCAWCGLLTDNLVHHVNVCSRRKSIDEFESFGEVGGTYP